ncbi:beta strand repeat-containing protein, partial [Microbacterium sp. C23T]
MLAYATAIAVAVSIAIPFGTPANAAVATVAAVREAAPTPASAPAAPELSVSGGTAGAASDEMVGQPAALDVRPFEATDVDAPTEPAPAETTTPAEPAPAPEPEPAPAPDPAPDPAPAVDPAPAPVEPTVVDPAPAAPAPAGPAPAAPAEPAPAAPAAPAPWVITMSGTSSSLVFHGDGTVTFEGVTRSLSEISVIRVTGTSGDDTFTIDFGGTDPGITIGFDGAAGFDTLATRGAGGFTSQPSDGSSGVMLFGATRVEYAGIEPIVADNDPGADVDFALADDKDDEAILEAGPSAGQLQLRSANGTFETTTFTAPVGTGTVLKITGGGGRDSLTIADVLNLGFAAFLAEFETITVTGSLSAGDITLTAAESNTDGIPVNVPDCTDFDDFSLTECLDHDADASVIVDGGSLTATGDGGAATGGITLTATATVVPDATAGTAYLVLAGADAVVDVRGGATITASGDFTATATSTVGPVTLIKDYGDAAFVTSNATATVGGDAVVDVDGAATISATSTVDVAATPQTDPSKDEDPLSSDFDAAVAILSVTASALGKITGNARMIVGGALGIAAANSAKLNAVGDAHEAGSGAGVAIAHLSQTTDAAIDSTNGTGTTAASLAILASQTADVTATAKASPGGASQNNKNSNGAGRGNGQASTSDGGIGISGAFGMALTESHTTGRIVGAKVGTTGTQTVTARGKNTIAVTGDGGTTTGSGGASGNGVGIGIALLISDLSTRAFVQGGAIDAAGGLTIAAEGPDAGDSSFTATAVSGKKTSGGSIAVAGSFALAKIDALTSATIDGAGSFANRAVSITSRGAHKSTAKATAKQELGGDNGSAVGAGASVALSLIRDDIVAAIGAGAAPSGIGALTMTATGADDATTTTVGGSDGGTSATLTGVASIAIHNVRTFAGILAGPALTLGSLAATATQTAKATTSATGATNAGAGSSLAMTISFALTSADHEVEVSVARVVTATGDVGLTADGTSTTATSAEASATGAPAENQGGGNAGSDNVNSKSDAKLGNAASRTSGGAGGGSITPQAKNEDGTSVSVAAAIAFNLVTSVARAMLLPGASIATGGTVSFVARADTDASASAKGTATNSSTVGIGAAVAVNKVTITTEAGVGVGSGVQASGLTITAQMKNAGTHTTLAVAEAGASHTNGTLGVAAAFALNIVNESTRAVLDADGSNSPFPGPGQIPGVVITGGGAVGISAGSKSNDKASAKATQSGDGTVGIGAAVALNLPTHLVYAGISPAADPTRGPPLTGAGAVSITATHDVVLTTEAEAGAASATVSVTPSVAILLAVIRTSASVGKGSAPLSASSITASATQTVTADTTAKGSTVAGSTAGIGISLALAILDDVSSTSGSDRSLTTTGAVSFTATQRIDATTTAKAAAQGAKPSEGKDSGGKDVNEKADDNLGNAKSTKSANGGGSTSTTQTPKAATGQNSSGSSSGNSVSIAGAIAIAVVSGTVTARFADGIAVNAGGAVSLIARGDTDSLADARGDTATKGSVGVGAGVAVQAVDITIRATTGASAITATGLTVIAEMLDGDADDVVRRWNDVAKRWETVESGEQLPGPSEGDLIFVKTNADGDDASGGDDGLYKYSGGSWSMETDVSLTGTVDALPGAVVDGNWYVLDAEKDGHPAGSVWKGEGGAWVFVTKNAVVEKSQLPTDQIAEDTWFELTKADGANTVGFYKRNGSHAWVKQNGVTVGDGDTLPTSPTADQLFRLFEHEIVSTARAGASKSTSVGVAGALAINILGSTIEALVPAGAVVTLSSGASVIRAQSNERDSATATSKAKVGSATGVGASFALQVIDGSDVTARISGAFSGGGALTVSATGFRDLATKAEGGTAGDTAVTPVVALVISVDDHVTARIAGGAATVQTGAVVVRATHVTWIATEGNADAAGKSTAVGATVVVNAVVGWDTLAEIARNVQGTAVTVEAVSEVRSEAKAVASAKGAESGGKSGDDESKDAVGGSNPNTQGTKSDTNSMPTSNGGTNGSNGASGANGQSSSQSGTGSGSTQVGAAVAVNWVVATSTARIAPNVTVTALSGAVTVQSLLAANARALAMGSAIDLQSSGTRVGAAISLNVQDITTRAEIGTDATVSGNGGVVVRASTPLVSSAPSRDDFVAWAFAAGGGQSTSFAGSAAVQILLLTTEAKVGAGATLQAANGAITVFAGQRFGFQNLAIAGALSTDSGAAIGGAFSVNYFEITTTAAIESGTAAGSVTTTNAAGATSVSATTAIEPLVPEVPKPLAGKIDWLKLSSVAIAGGASSGGAAVTGAFIVDIFDVDTRAWIGDGAQVNQTIAGGAGQSVTVRAEDSLDVVDVGGTLALSQSSASVGITVVVVVANSDVRAWIGSSAAAPARGGGRAGGG